MTDARQLIPNATTRDTGWQSAQTVKLPGVAVELSRPRLVDRSRDYLWFPTIAQRGDGALVCLAQEHPDVSHWPVPQWAYFSRDGGLSWPQRSRIPNSTETFVPLPGGDLLLMPYYLLKTGNDMEGYGYRLRCGSTAVEPLPQMVRITDWPIATHCIPKPDTAPPEERRIAGVVCGQVVRGLDGRYLTTLYVTVSLKPRSYGVLIAESHDALNWRILAPISVMDSPGFRGAEGANEATLARLRDGRLMCVYRTGGWHPPQPFAQSFSSDDGRTWSAPEPMPAGESFIAPMAVQPSLVAMPSGPLLVAGGRPGMRFWIDPTGTATQWHHLDVQLHHTWCVPDEPILQTDHASRKQSTSYTELLALDDRRLLLAYDRTPCGWDRIPDDNPATNSIWVVLITLHVDAKQQVETPESPT
jgi:hypothetical protein